MLILRRPWTEQPQEAVAASAWFMQRRGAHLAVGDLQYDAAGGRLVPPTVVSGSRTVSIGSAGCGVVGIGASSSNQTRGVFQNSSFTAFFIGNPPSDASNTRFALSQYNGASLVAMGANFSDQFTAAGAGGRFALTMLESGVNRSHAYVASAADGLMHCFLVRKSGATVTMWIDGVQRTVVSSGGFAGSPVGAADTFYCGGQSVDGAKAFGGPSGDAVLFATGLLQSALTDAECAELSTIAGAYALAFEPRRIYIPTSVSGGGSVTGTLATTNANDTITAVGSTTIIGTLARTNGNDTLVASGSTTIIGTLARTNANDTVVATGSAGAVSGTLATTNANDSIVAVGSTTILGTLARTNSNDLIAANGVVGNITGTLARTNANDSVVASGVVPIWGTLAKTNNNDLLAASGTSGTTYSATIKAGSWIRYRIIT